MDGSDANDEQYQPSSGLLRRNQGRALKPPQINFSETLKLQQIFSLPILTHHLLHPLKQDITLPAKLPLPVRSPLPRLSHSLAEAFALLDLLLALALGFFAGFPTFLGLCFALESRFMFKLERLMLWAPSLAVGSSSLARLRGVFFATGDLVCSLWRSGFVD